MILLFKKGNIGDPENYRPITILSVARKLIEIIIWNRIEHLFNNNNNLIPFNQAGFRKNRGCIEQCLIVQKAIDDGKRLNKERWIVFLDFKQAYDSVSHNGLLFKLMNATLNRPLVRWINNLLSSSKCFLTGFEDEGYFDIKCGVPQGSVLSPFLFNIFINDLAKSEFIRDRGLLILNNKIGSILYADDTTLLSDNYQNCQDQLNWVVNWSENWGMQLHPVKTEVMVICRRNNYQPISMYNVYLSRCLEYKYLGIQISQRVKRQQSKSIILSAEKRFRSFSTVFSHGGLFSGYAKKLCYSHIIRPVILFGTEIYGVPKCAIQLERKILKSILGTYKNVSNMEVRRVLGIWNIISWGDLYCLLFLHRMLTSRNICARAIANAAIHNVESSIWCERIQKLFTKYNLGADIINNIKNLDYNVWGGMIREKIVERDIVDCEDLTIQLRPNQFISMSNNFVLTLYTTEHDPLHSKREFSYRLVDYGGRYTKVGFMIWRNSMNPRDVVNSNCYICGSDLDVPLHLIECTLQRLSDSICIEDWEFMRVNCLNAQILIKEILLKYECNLQEFTHLRCNNVVYREHIQVVLGNFSKLYRCRTICRKFSIGVSSNSLS